ncbi:MAG: hypothetical protein IIV77_05935 [Bacteroidaceae bacterium]|nr:hypothetical protein [Bacteroidaceae bacterium]
MRHPNLFVLLLSALCFVASSRNVDKNKNQVSLSLWGITVQGENQDEVIRNLIEQTDEFDYYDDDRTEIWRLMFCGVPFGLNLDSVQTNGVTNITNITLISSHQSKADFEAIKNGLSKRLGNPDIEDYEGGTDEIEGRFYGRCAWYRDECNATLRNLHSEEGGLVVFFEYNNDHIR